MRIRIYFSKTSMMRYTSHLDLHKTWERTFRRADLPLAYSQGFHPQPRINLACALPLGFTSQAEIMDVWLDQDIDLDVVSVELSRALPPGIQIERMEIIAGREPALQVQVQSAVYEITLLGLVPDLKMRVESVNESTYLPRERRGKAYDLRPLIELLDLISNNSEGNQRLTVQLSARASATGRPEELLDVLGIDPLSARVHRTGLLFAYLETKALIES